MDEYLLIGVAIGIVGFILFSLIMLLAAFMASDLSASGLPRRDK